MHPSRSSRLSPRKPPLSPCPIACLARQRSMPVARHRFGLSNGQPCRFPYEFVDAPADVEDQIGHGGVTFWGRVAGQAVLLATMNEVWSFGRTERGALGTLCSRAKLREMMCTYSQIGPSCVVPGPDALDGPRNLNLI